MGGSRDGEKAATGHGTQKPVRLFELPIVHHTLPNDAVYDPFCGSGTAIIAEKLGRACYAMEIDPKYVQVAVRRWEAFTGQPAIRQRVATSTRRRPPHVRSVSSPRVNDQPVGNHPARRTIFRSRGVAPEPRHVEFVGRIRCLSRECIDSTQRPYAKVERLPSCDCARFKHVFRLRQVTERAAIAWHGHAAWTDTPRPPFVGPTVQPARQTGTLF
jgi:hypothetical protein